MTDTEYRRHYTRHLRLAPGEQKAHHLETFARFAIRSHAEVGQILGITRQAVQMIERKALWKIRFKTKTIRKEHYHDMNIREINPDEIRHIVETRDDLVHGVRRPLTNYEHDSLLRGRFGHEKKDVKQPRRDISTRFKKKRKAVGVTVEVATSPPPPAATTVNGNEQ